MVDPLGARTESLTVGGGSPFSTFATGVASGSAAPAAGSISPTGAAPAGAATAGAAAGAAAAGAVLASANWQNDLAGVLGRYASLGNPASIGAGFCAWNPGNYGYGAPCPAPASTPTTPAGTTIGSDEKKCSCKEKDCSSKEKVLTPAQKAAEATAPKASSAAAAAAQPVGADPVGDRLKAIDNSERYINEQLSSIPQVTRDQMFKDMGLSQEAPPPAENTWAAYERDRANNAVAAAPTCLGQGEYPAVSEETSQ
jgi:hypothetical protein